MPKTRKDDENELLVLQLLDQGAGPSKIGRRFGKPLHWARDLRKRIDAAFSKSEGA